MLTFGKFSYCKLKITNSKPNIAKIPITAQGDKMQPMIGLRLRELREKKKLRQEQVAEITNVNKSAISLYESGMRQPSLDMLIVFARFYKVSTDYLLGISATKSVDLSGLTGPELDVILELVSLMTRKNELINKR